MNGEHICIEITNVSKTYKKTTLLDNISLQIEEGKTYGFVGYNGSGKSLLFKAICGLTKIQEGQIIVNNEQIGKDTDFINNAGVIVETPNFIPSLSGIENLRLLAEIQHTISDKEINEALVKVGLESHKDKKVKHYSLGMKQRLRIAQAIMENPKILILDEPFNGLDKDGIEIIHQLLLKEKSLGKTILLTSHHENDIDTLCDVVFEMNNGKIEANTKGASK
ncbi:ATP-binding cassette domain-containing protein [Bacillus sp. A116_S68]|nr:ATP-binding cassette domain-containing protein [Bacillus sp. A116_S68]